MTDKTEIAVSIMPNGQPIETAPKDGTVILLKNAMMDEPVRGHWGEFQIELSDRVFVGWVSDWTPTDFLPFRAGCPVCPDEWSPLSETEGAPT